MSFFFLSGYTNNNKHMEIKMRLDIDKLTTDPTYVGSKVYICAFILNDSPISRAVKNLPATECMVETLENYKLKAKKPVMIPGKPDNVFIKVRTRGTINHDNIVKPYDNTAQRFSKKTDLHIFDNLDECNDFYLSLIRS